MNGIFPISRSDNLPSNSNNKEIFRVKASKLIDFFQDELVIQQKTVSIIRHDLLSQFIETIPLNEFDKTALTEAGPFATLTILGKTPDAELTIKGLPVEKAEQAKYIIDKLLLERLS